METEEISLETPEKSETLAYKVEERAERRRLLTAVKNLPAKRWVAIGEVLFLTLLFLLNFWLLSSFFGQEDKTNTFSAPLIPFLTQLTSFLIPFPQGIRFWTLTFLMILPLSFYFFVREISGRKMAAVVAALTVSLPVGVFLSLRTEEALTGDGALVSSLTLTLLTCLILLNSLRKGNFNAMVGSGLGVTLVALTSPLGLATFLVFALTVTFSEMLLSQARVKLLRFLTVIVLAAGLSAFWYNPRFALLILGSSQGEVLTRTLTTLLPLSFFLVPTLGIFGFLLFENRPQLQPLFLALFLTVAFGIFSLTANIAFVSSSRFLPAFGIAGAFLIGIVTVFLYDFLRFSPRLERLKFSFPLRQLLALGLLGVVFVLLIIAIVSNGSSFRELGDLKILGATANQKIGIWEIKEKTTLAEKIFGYLITGLTCLGVAILRTKLDSTNVSNRKQR